MRPSLHTRLLAWLLSLLTATMAAFAAVLLFAVQYGVWGGFDERLRHEVDAGRSVLAPYWTVDGISAPDYINPIPPHDRRWLEVWSLDGQRLFRSPQAESAPLDDVGAPTIARAWSVRTTVEPMRVLDAPSDIVGLPVVVRVAESEVAIRAQIRTIWISMAASLVVCLAGALWSGYRLTRRALRPLDDLVMQTADVTAERLGRGVQVADADREVHAVAEAFNDTLRRLSVSFEQARRFSADASHELRTPLTSIRAVGQLALQDRQDPGQYRDAIASMVEDTERLGRLLDSLLLLSRADAQQIALARTAIDVDVLVRATVEQRAVLAEEKQLALTVDTVPARVFGDADVLGLALGNLLDNAIRYTPSLGRVHVAVAVDGSRVSVSVTDSGPGIAPEHHARLFDRFYRVDGPRSRQSGGAGLGLSIAAWAALAHGGRVSVDSAPGAGSTFRIDVPSDKSDGLRTREAGEG